MRFRYQLAKEFLKMNCNVFMSSRSESLTDEAIQELDAYKDLLHYVVCDVRNPESIRNLWNQSIQKWGNVDIWINNAGINSTHDLPGKLSMRIQKLTIISQIKRQEIKNSI